MNKNITIIGGGQAAAYAAKEIRSIDGNVNISIFGDEIYFPYERPPLSKDCLLEKKNYDQCLFFPTNYYAENNIDYHYNEKIDKIDFETKKLISLNNQTYSYDKLLITTGSKNRKLNNDIISKEISDNIIYLRNIEDSKKIKNKLSLSKKVLIIGGGFIGLEIASAANQLNKDVIIVEAADSLMGRVIPSQISKIVQTTHENYGCKFFLGEQVENIFQTNNGFECKLKSGSVLKSDLIIAGIGSIPNTDLFQNTDLKLDNGIVTNEFSETSIENVFAAGDVSNFYHPFYDMYIRLESYQHAQNHGINAGKNIAGIRTSYNAIPWMWSDQFNLNLQLTGICNDYDDCIQRGNNIEEGIIYFFLKNKCIIGACGVGIKGKIGRDIRLSAKLSENKTELTKQILSDTNQKLNKVLTNINNK